MNHPWLKISVLPLLVAIFCLLLVKPALGQSEELAKIDAKLKVEKAPEKLVRLLTQKAKWIAVSYPDSARELALEALRYASITGSTIDSVLAYNQIGRAYYAQSKYDTATVIQKNALDLSLKNPDSTRVHAKLYNDLAVCLNSNGLTDSALVLNQKALAMREALGDEEGIAGSINNIAIIFHDKGMINEARERYLIVKKKYEEIDNKEGIGTTYNNLATLEIAQGDYALGMQYMLDALEIFEKLDQKFRVLVLSSNLAYLYEIHSQFDLAEENNNKAISLAKQLDNSQFLGKALSTRGSLLIKRDSVDSGMAAIIEAISIFRELNTPGELGNAMLYLSDGLEKKKLYDSAVNTAMDARTLWEKYDYTYGVAIADNRLAEYYNSLGDYRNAIQYGTEGLEIAKAVNAKETIRDAAGALSQAYAGLASYERAYDFQKTYQLLHDSLYNAQKGFEIARLEFNFDRKKNAEQFKLKQDYAKSIQENELQRQRFIIFGIIAALLITGTIAASLQRRKKIVQQLNTELEAQKSELENRNKELNALNEVKDKIFSIISHDLRSPLTTLINLIDVSSESDFTQEEIQAYLKELGHQAKHTSGMLDNLLYWVQNQRSSFTVRPELVDVSHVVDELTNLFSLAAQQKNVKLRNQIPIGSKAFVDPNSLKLILRNLLSNAIKFSVRGGAIEVISNHDAAPAGMIEILVKDYGVGMSEEHRERLFNVSGISKRGTFSEHGIGLGLVLVKEFVDKNGGTITVDSQPGEGTTFTISLPTKESSRRPSLLDVMQN